MALTPAAAFRPRTRAKRFGAATGHDESGRALASLLAAVAVVVTFGALVPVVVVVSAAADCAPSGGEPTQLAAGEIPADYIELYQEAGDRYGLAWPVLAAIGWLETRHGTLDAPGVASGSNSSGAAGPMQFGIGGLAGNTWGGAPVRSSPPVIAYGMDGNGDGIANVYDPADAIPAAAAYLVAHGAPTELRKAVYAYNHAGWYVDKVLAKAADYGAGDGEVAAPSAEAVGCDSPYLNAGSEGPGVGPWGGHTNGRIPLDQLCPVSGVVHLLRCDAAGALEAMMAAHLADTGRALIVTDAYRDYAGQVDVAHRKPHLAAKPGYSNHGWGLAIDAAVGGWDGPTFRWLQTNAHRYGWHHPPWARIDGSKPEPWHWEFGR